MLYNPVVCGYVSLILSLLDKEVGDNTKIAFELGKLLIRQLCDIKHMDAVIIDIFIQIICLVLRMDSFRDQIFGINLMLAAQNENVDDIRKYIIVICK